MVKLRRLPTGNGVALFAGVREVGGGVIRVGRSIKRIGMARETGSRGVRVTVSVALSTSPRSVTTSQGEGCGMGEGSTLPGPFIERMTTGAVARKPSLDMRRGGRPVIFREVAADTLGGSVDVATTRVTTEAVHCAVCSGEGEASDGVAGSHLRAVLPSIGRMADGTLRTKLAGMRLLMARSTLINGFLERQRRVAFATGHAFVASFEWEGGGGVIELDVGGLDRPAVRVMTDIAGNLDVGVRTLAQDLTGRGDCQTQGKEADQ